MNGIGVQKFDFDPEYAKAKIREGKKIIQKAILDGTEEHYRGHIELEDFKADNEQALLDRNIFLDPPDNQH